MIKLYNSLTRKKEVLKPRKGRQINMFVCGPTVYDYPHIGHARTYIVFDAFAKYLASQKYKVSYLQNITDIDDKIIERARQEKTTPHELAQRFEAFYHEDEARIGVGAVTTYARATDHIDNIVQQIQTLIKKGCAYEIHEDGYYFDIATFKDYGKLSGRTVLQAEDATSRIDESLKKRNKGDFALWKFSSNEPLWNTPLGRGRPGWHIEDTAITEHYFGSQYDIHGGARDLIFPHHEAEIAEQECASRKSPLARVWMHTGFLLIRGEKMSKSLGNFITIRDFLEKYPKEVLRLMILGAHYRSPVNYTDELAEQTKRSLETIQTFLRALASTKTGAGRAVDPIIKKTSAQFLVSLHDDFNTPKALAVIFLLMRRANTLIVEKKLSPTTKKSIEKTFKLLDSIFSIVPEITEETIPEEITRLARAREEARKEKRWSDADTIREEIKKLGYIVEDTPKGPILSSLRS